MITENDKKILTEVGRKYIFDIASESTFLKNKLTFKDHIDVCEQINKLTYEEVISLTITEDIRSFERKFKTFLKYGMAAIAGGALGGMMTAAPPVAMFILYLYRKDY